MPIRKEMRPRYPRKWKEISHRIRFERAGGKCEWCGAEHGKPHPITGSKVVLTCAHVYDPSPENIADDNLAALCQKCHNGHDAKERARGRKERCERDQLKLMEVE